MNQYRYGLFRVVAACPEVALADTMENVKRIAGLCAEIEEKCQPALITFPELSLSGYSCEEMFNQQNLSQSVEEALEELMRETACRNCLIAVGLPLIYNSRRYNAAAIIKGGKLLAMIPKIYLPNSKEFYEARYFESGSLLPKEGVEIEYASQRCHFGVRQLFDLGKASIGIELCEDFWVPIPPSSYAALNGANVILNLSASNEVAGKHDFRKTLLSACSARLHCAYVYASSSFGESSDDLVWGGSSLIYEDGQLLAENKRFDKKANWIAADIDLDALQSARLKSSTFYDFEHKELDYIHIDCGEPVQPDFEEKLYRELERHPFFPGSTEQIDSRCREVFEIQVRGLMGRLEHINCRKAVIGVSGGLDSTLALLVCCEAFDRIGLDRKGIIAVTMPCFGTSKRTYSNALGLMEELGVSLRDIDIAAACELHFQDLALNPERHDSAYENSQARERTQILMDLANSEGGIVIGTGDLSELALGWCTYNGDHMSMYGVNVGVPKTLIREICRRKALELNCRDIILDIIDTPVSPELIPGAQMTEDLVGPYELHDFFLWHFFDGSSPRKIWLYACKAFEGQYEASTVLKWLKIFYKRFFSQQFKRSCLPNGPKTCKVSLSPRGDWRMSTDTVPRLWLKELDEIVNY